MKTSNIFAIVLSLLAVSLAFADGEAEPILEDGIVKVENDGRAIFSVHGVGAFPYHPKSFDYELTGLVRYSDLEGVVLLQVANNLDGHFRSHNLYVRLEKFVMTQELYGEETNEWRPFSVRFSTTHRETKPVIVAVQVMIFGRGTVELANLTVRDIHEIKHITWFDNHTAGWISRLLNIAGGLYGALFGCLAGFLVPLGKGRRLIIGLLWFGLAAGALLLLIGLTALFLGQPYHVWYSFVLPGVILLILTPIFLVVMPQQYAQAELRRMQALDM